jgi:deoxyribose-phosphate aldolase
MDLNLDWIESIQVNKSATERRAATLGARRSVKKQHQAAWLLKAITLIDLTTLAGDDTELRVKRLCAKAMKPIRHDLVTALGIEDLKLTTGAICVYHDMLTTAARELKGTGIHLAAVSTGFPAGLTPVHL